MILRMEREDASQTFVDYSRSTTSIYRPLVEFVTLSGERITFKSSVASNPPQARVCVPVGAFLIFSGILD